MWGGKGLGIEFHSEVEELGLVIFQLPVPLRRDEIVVLDQIHVFGPHGQMTPTCPGIRAEDRRAESQARTVEEWSAGSVHCGPFAAISDLHRVELDVKVNPWNGRAGRTWLLASFTNGVSRLRGIVDMPHSFAIVRYMMFLTI